MTMKRLAISCLLLCLVAWMAGPVFAGEGDDTPRSLSIAISPVSGNVGTVISISGNGADAGQPVFVSLSPAPDSAEGAFVVESVSAAKDGSFSAAITVPEGVTDGRYFVRGEQFTDIGNAMHYYYNSFVVGNPGPEAFLPVTGTLPGTPLTVTAALALLLVLALVTRGLYALSMRKK
jgi:hypothetical protein